MKLNLTKGKCYLLSKGIQHRGVYTYPDRNNPLEAAVEARIDPIHNGLDINNHLLISVDNIEHLSTQFIEITFRTLCPSIYGDVSHCNITVVDDNVDFPPNYRNWISYGRFVKSIYPYKNEMRSIENKIKRNDHLIKEAKQKFTKVIEMEKLAYEVVKNDYTTTREKLAKELSFELDNLMYKHQERDAYNKEMENFTR